MILQSGRYAGWHISHVPDNYLHRLLKLNLGRQFELEVILEGIGRGLVNREVADRWAPLPEHIGTILPRVLKMIFKP